MDMPLTELSFKKKPGFEDAYWPIEKKDLDPFLDKALSILDVSRPSDDVVLDSEFGIKEFSISLSQVRFGQKYREELKSLNNITCVTNANLTGLKTDGQRVVSATSYQFLRAISHRQGEAFHSGDGRGSKTAACCYGVTIRRMGNSWTLELP